MNRGAESSGNVMATLVSADADVTVSSAGPVDLGTMAYGAVATTDGVLAFDVSADHVDSTDVYLEIHLDDGVETWTLPFSVPVPYPLLKITKIDIGDRGRDGILDAGEEAELTFQVTNTGGESCDGSVSGVLSVSTSGGGTVTAAADRQVFGAIASGATKEADGFDMELVGGAAGDRIDLVLTLADGSRSYEATASIVVGEPPWTAINPTDDPTGDPRGEDFDIVNAAYRVIDGTLRSRWSRRPSSTPPPCSSSSGERRASPRRRSTTSTTSWCSPASATCAATTAASASSASTTPR